MKPTEVRAIRRALGLTQVEMGKRLGLTARQISRYETGRQAVPKRTALALRSLRQQP